MEGRVIKVVQDANSLVGRFSDLLAVVAVCVVQRLSVASQREVTVNNRILRCEVRLVEIVSVLHVRASGQVENKWRVWANKHGHRANTTGWSGGTLRVDSNVACHDNGVSTIPGRRLDPVDGVDNSRGSTVARVDRVDTFNVVVVAKKLHQNRLDRLGLVQQGLGSDLQSTNRVGVDVVVLQQSRSGSQRDGVNVLSVRDEGHVGLAQANGVFARWDLVEFLQLGLVDVVCGDVDLDGLDTDVFD